MLCYCRGVQLSEAVETQLLPSGLTEAVEQVEHVEETVVPQEMTYITLQVRRLKTMTGLILALRPANERRRYFVTSLIGWARISPEWSLLLTLWPLGDVAVISKV